MQDTHALQLGEQMAEQDIDVQRLPVNLRENDPRLKGKLIQQIKQLMSKINSLENRVRELEKKIERARL